MAKAGDKNYKKNWLLVAAAIILIVIIFGALKISRQPTTGERISEEEILERWRQEPAGEPKAPNPEVIRSLTAPPGR